MRILPYAETHQCAAAFGDLGWESLPYFLLLECVYKDLGRDVDLAELYREADVFDKSTADFQYNFAVMRGVRDSYREVLAFGFIEEDIVWETSFL